VTRVSGFRITEDGLMNKEGKKRRNEKYVGKCVTRVTHVIRVIVSAHVCQEKRPSKFNENATKDTNGATFTR
jgi:hypothetical protein